MSAAAALDKLRVEHRLFEDSVAQIRTAPLKLPTGEVTSIVVVIAQELENSPSWGVALASSTVFTGRNIAGNVETFEISLLDRAWVARNGTVELSDGTHLHAVNVIPTPICRELAPLQRRIVYWTIKLIRAEAKCYRGRATKDLRHLDYSNLYGLRLPTLKAIERYIRENDPQLSVSRQTIANALAACGMRRPRSGRLAVASSTATFSPEFD